MLFCLTVVGCGKINADFPTGNFHILVISDTHISSDQTKIDRLRELNHRINQGVIPGICMLVHTGDVVSSVYKRYKGEAYDRRDSRLARADQLFSQLDIPFYWVMGNHDYKIDSDRDSDAPFQKKELMRMEKIWKEMTDFDPFYAVFYRGWKFIFMNSMRGCYQERNFDGEQLIWLEKELEERIPAVLFFHHPLKTDHFRLWEWSSRFIEPETEPDFYRILKKYQIRIKVIFVGHEHHFISDTLFGNIPVYETASFADDENGPYIIVGFNNSEKTIDVGKGHMY
jgi:3',5'-cyclic AMP phosphodiesterase CpdA